jgi:ATP-dependent DNA helicase RecG
VTTLLRSDGEWESVAEFVRGEIRRGRQAYFVYPLIEESEKLDLKAATVHFNHLQKIVFPGFRLGLMHGRLPGAERDDVMRKFTHRALDILVATTVIEVGIDVPNASVMVIENAEHFGLAQLHQLRGRVGRGSDQSTCIMMTKGWLARAAKRVPGMKADRLALDQQRVAEQRLAAMVQTTDGFVIAETDLRLRGPGDYFGTRQSGIPAFRVADILTDTALLNDARADAFSLVETDPHLARADHRALALHLRAREQDAPDLLKVG